MSQVHCPVPARASGLMEANTVGGGRRAPSKPLRRAFLATVAIASIAASAQAQTGNDLLGWCNSYAAQSSSDPAEVGFERGLCAGYIAALLNTMTIAPVYGMRVCGKGITYWQAKDVVHKWLLTNPQDRHRPASALVVVALYEAFACR